jgi:hypothetical protein
VSLAMTTPGGHGGPSEALMQILNATSTTRSLIEGMQPVMSIVARQQEAMEAMRGAFEKAALMQPPPATRMALANLIHRLVDQPLAAATPTASVEDAEQAVVALLPRTPEEVDQLRQGVGEIEASPEFSEKLQRLVSGIDWATVSELTGWVALVWVARQLFQVADWPVTRHLSADQIAALQDRLLVLAVIVTMAQIILTMRRR